jgi:hypothetical protein
VVCWQQEQTNLLYAFTHGPACITSHCCFSCCCCCCSCCCSYSFLRCYAGVLHWQSPHFFAWFAGNTSGPSILAEMLIGGLNMIGFSWQSSPISTELEMVSETGACALAFGVLSYSCVLVSFPGEQPHQHRGDGGTCQRHIR